MPASDYPYFSKEAAIACGIGATLALIIAAMVIIGLRNHETPSHKLDGATVEAANQVDISTASQAPDEE